MPVYFRVIVTGSRNWKNQLLVERELKLLWYEHRYLKVIHGACPNGADAYASNWVEDQPRRRGMGLVQRDYPARWRVGGFVDPSAGFRRNREMVRDGADLCLAFVAPCISSRCHRIEVHGSHGTSDCAEQARRYRITVKRFDSWRRISGGTPVL